MERCVLCWRETDIPKDTPVSRRKYYLEGQGQSSAPSAITSFTARVCSAIRRARRSFWRSGIQRKMHL